MIAPLFARARWGPLAGLIGLGLSESVLMIAAALSLSAVIATGGGATVVASVLFAFGAAAALWARQVLAEDFGMRYANALRGALAEHAVAVGGANRPRRLGAMAVRMTSDLNAQREWAALGISETVSAISLGVAGVVVLTVVLGGAGLLVALASTLPSLVSTGLFFALLGRVHQHLRVERGRVAALAGDLVLAAPAVAGFSAGRRELARLARRGERLRAVAVRRRKAAAAVAAPALMGQAAGVGAVWALVAQGVLAPLPASGWAGVLFALGFLGVALSSWGRIVDWLQAFRVAQVRMRSLEQEALEANAASPTPADPDTAKWMSRLAEALQARPPRPGDPRVLWVENSAGATAFEQITRLAAEARASLPQSPDELEAQGRHGSAEASPDVPLLRASVRRNLSIRRQNSTDIQLARALTAVGLASEAVTLDMRIEPSLGNAEANLHARLRLARCIADRPQIIFLAEPTLMFAPEYEDLVVTASETAKAIVVAPMRAALPMAHRTF